MRLCSIACLAAALFACPAALADPASEAAVERTLAANMLALGSLPGAEELAAATESRAPLAERIATLRGQLARSPDLARAVHARAWRDAFGTEPPAAPAPSESALTYTEHMASHLKALAARPELYRATIERAYGRAVRRAPHDIEYAYWADRDVLPFMVLTACVEHWAQRNAPGLMSTTGQPSVSIRSQALHAARLSPAVAAEARAVTGLPVADAWAQARQWHLIAPGSGKVAAVGGIHLVVIGRHPTPAGSP